MRSVRYVVPGLNYPADSRRQSPSLNCHFSRVTAARQRNGAVLEGMEHTPESPHASGWIEPRLPPVHDQSAPGHG
jgi:hypothetical protein